MVASGQSLSFVIPIYNEVDSLPILHEKISHVAQELKLPYEIIFVDDGSTDGSTQVLKRLFDENEHVVFAVLRRNFGKAHALRTGFELAQNSIIITMDADLQDEPAEVPRLLAKLDEGYDVVSGWKEDRQDPLSKTIPSLIANTVISWTAGTRFRDINSGLKAYRSDVIKRLTIYGDLHRYTPLLAHSAGFKVGEVPVLHHKREYGRSKYGPKRLLSSGFDLITIVFLQQYGYKPLHLFGGIGSFLFGAGFLIDLWLTIDWVLGPAKPLSQRPLLFLGILLMLLGVQLFSLGLIADLLVAYIQRTENILNSTRVIYHRRDDAHKIA
jgi:glycosyltransferase involved in cell wall biosynthesis